MSIAYKNMYKNFILVGKLEGLEYKLISAKKYKKITEEEYNELMSLLREKQQA